ncbi:MAG TPA: MFS transporter [Candidatus Sulfotelmatobacter sp.]|jgi:MFS family permease|nr:MFS transporter [Candidatus Sulfotelmatobacter sp.]
MKATRLPGESGIPKGVWALGFVSLLMDTSSEMIHSLLPVFLTSVLGVSALSVGIIEGIAEATAAVTKVFSGAVSDWAGKRKPLVLFGYGLAALTKPVFALAPSVGWVVGARFADRLGKGIRGAPRDALMADLTPPPLMGAAFGLRQSLDTVGAFAGPLAAVAVMFLSIDNYRLVFWLASVPAVLAVLLIVVGIDEPATHKPARNSRLSWADVKRFPASFWAVAGIAVLMTLARFSEGFLLLRAQSVGLEAAWVPLVFVAMNLVYAASAYPVGRLSDRIGRRGLLLGGFAILILADLVLARAGTVWQVMAGVALWGLHMGMTQGLLSALVADSAPGALRGTAFGIFNLAVGVALLLASVIAGGLWTAIGPAATFEAGAAFTAVALLALAVFNRGGRS